jgi:hypothetical protein
MISPSSFLISLTLVQWGLLFLFNKPDINGSVSASVVKSLNNALPVLVMPRTRYAPISATIYKRSLRRVRDEQAFIFLELPKSIRLRIYEFLFSSGKSTPQLNPSPHHLHQNLISAHQLTTPVALHVCSYNKDNSASARDPYP